MAAIVMTKTYAGVLPTVKNSNSYPVRLDYFNHFINLKCVDFFYGNALKSLKDINKKVIDNTVNRYWTVIKDNTNSLQKDDLKAVALETAWLATDKYISGVEKWNIKGSTKKMPIKVNYQDNFNFCKFANEQIKFKFRLVIYKDKITSSATKLPDSDSIRSIFFNLNKWKNESNLCQKNCLSNIDIKNLSKKYGYKFKDIQLVNLYQSQVIINGDSKLSDDSDEKYWDIIEDKNKNTETHSNNNNVINKFKILKEEFLNNLGPRDKYILNEYKFKEDKTLKELSIKFNISPEGIRKISERRFKDFEKFIIKNQKGLYDPITKKLNLIE